MTSGSELTALVETEQRLDEAVASARTAANAIREAARERARTATNQLDGSLEAERVRIAEAMEKEAADRERAIEQDANDRIARFEAIRADVLDRIADVLAKRVAEIAVEES